MVTAAGFDPGSDESPNRPALHVGDEVILMDGRRGFVEAANESTTSVRASTSSHAR